MQVWVAVNEADIGNIKPGQSVTFTVDAYPGQVFTGQVGKVRLNASMTQNVVTYTVEVITDNSNGKLLPYLTANVQFEVGRREGVLMVPNAALRWSAPPQLIAKNARGAGSGGQRKAGGGSGGAPGGGGAAVSGADSPRGTVWVQDGKFVRPIRVQAGLSDGTMTEVQSDKLPEGTEVVISQSVSSGHGGSAADTTSAGTNTNPFIPQMPGRRR
jgi:HlyD family secretion protein